MKKILIGEEHSNALLDFINTEIINGSKELEGIIESGNALTNSESIYLYECFQSLSKKYSIQEIESKFTLWFPYGIMISANDFSYEIVKKYTLYLSQKYKINEKELFFNPQLIFEKETDESVLKEIQKFLIHYKENNNFIENLKNQLISKNKINIQIDENKFLKTRMIINVTEKNKHLLEYFIEEDVFSGNSRIEYAGKSILLLEFLLLRSLSCSQEIIKKLVLQINKRNLIEITQNIKNINLSYLDNFKEESENFKENMNLLEKKMLLLKYEDDERSSGSSSKGVVKI